MSNCKWNMVGCNVEQRSLCGHTLEKFPKCKVNQIAFSTRCITKTEATKAAQQSRRFGLAGQASPSAAGDMATAQGLNRVALGGTPRVEAQGGSDDDDEEFADVDEEDLAAGGGQDMSRGQKLGRQPGLCLTSTLRLQWEAWPTMVRVIRYNCARSYNWAIGTPEMGVERSADLVSVQEPLRDR